MDGLGEALKAFVTRETLLVFLLLIVPGTISLRLYDRIRARQSRNITESFFDIVIVSFINDAFWAYLTNAIVHAYQTRFFPSWWIAFQFVLAIMISPCLLTVIYVISENILAERGVVTDAEASPWDKWFRAIKADDLQIAVILVMKSDYRPIGGRYKSPGFASSAPVPREIHIGET